MAKSTPLVTFADNVLEYLYSPTVKIIVGGEGDTEQQSFFVHVDLITSRSEFFANALKQTATTLSCDTDTKCAIDWPAQSSVWLEGHEGVVKLPVDDPVVFKGYVQLLYSKQLPIKVRVDQGTAAEQNEDLEKELRAEVDSATNSEYLLLAKLYVLCDKLQDLKSKEIVLRAFIDMAKYVRPDNSTRCLTPVPISIIYAGTSPSDPLRLFLVDCYVLRGYSAWETTSYTVYPHEFCFHVMQGLWTMRKIPADRTRLEDTDHYTSRPQSRASTEYDH